MASRDRKKQQVTGGHGKHFISPRKVRNSSSRRAKIYLASPGERDELRARLESLFSPPEVPEITEPDPGAGEWMDVDETDNTQVAAEAEQDTSLDRGSTTAPSLSPLKTKRRILPNTATYHLYHKWLNIVPGLVEEYLRYTNSTMGKPVGSGCLNEILRPDCTCGHQRAKMSSLTCLYFDRECIHKLH